MKILLVDDQVQFVSVLSRRLNMRGLDTVCAFSPEEALKVVDTGTFDVAVLDMKMPGMSGIELKRHLHLKNPGMKFIFLTGHGSEQEYKIVAAEAAVFLPKPLKIDQLIEAIHQTVAEKS